MNVLLDDWNKKNFETLLRLSNSEIMFQNEYIRELWPNLTYMQQKRVVYTLVAYRNLYNISHSSNEKMKNDIEVKQAMLAC